MISIEEIKKEMKKLKEVDSLQRMVRFTSLLTAYFEVEGIKPIIVGGLSVEIYTRGEYTTSDIDLIADGYDKFNELLIQLGFERTGKDWYHSFLEISVEIPSNSLDGSYDNVYKITLNDGRYVYVIGIEDIIIHRLESAYLSNKENPEFNLDYEWAKRLFLLHNKEIDMEYLLEQGEKTKTIPSIDKWIREHEDT